MPDEDIAVNDALAAPNYYKLMLLEHGASSSEIKRAYKQLLRKLHPDKAQGPHDRADAAFKRLSEAFTTLSDPLARVQYDAKLLEEEQVEESLRIAFEGTEPRDEKRHGRLAVRKYHTAKSEQLKRQADAALTAGGLDKAVYAYTRAIYFDASNASLYSNRAVAYLSLGQHMKALADAESGLKIRPEWAKLHSRRATALERLECYNEAVEAWRSAMVAEDQAGSPEEGWSEALKQAELVIAARVDQLKQMAADAVKGGRLDEAADAYTRAIEIDATNATLFSNRSLVYMERDMFVEALADADSGLQLQPDWAKLHSRRASALDGLFQLGEAVLAWRAAIDATDQTGSPKEGWTANLKAAEHALVAEVEQLKKQAEQEMSEGRSDEAVQTYASAISMALEPYAGSTSSRGSSSVIRSQRSTTKGGSTVFLFRFLMLIFAMLSAAAFAPDLGAPDLGVRAFISQSSVVMMATSKALFFKVDLEDNVNNRKKAGGFILKRRR
jgi:curved DNA-binding protein CbpA